MNKIVATLLTAAFSPLATPVELDQWALRVDTGAHYSERYEPIAVVIDFMGRYQFLDRERTLGRCASRDGLIEAQDLEALRDTVAPILSHYRLQPPIVSECMVSHPPPSTEFSFVYSLGDGSRDAFRFAVPGYFCDPEGIYRDAVEFKQQVMGLIERLPGNCTETADRDE